MADAAGKESEQNEWLRQIIRMYEKDIFRICFFYLGNEEDARDAAQETFLKAWCRYRKFRKDCSEKTWLMKIAVNRCRDMKRSAWFRRVSRNVTPEQINIPYEQTNEQNVDLASAVMRLAGKQKEVILLRYDQGMSVTETAKVLGISPAAVTQRCKHALETLRRELTENEDIIG
ncbi:MAG: RNA polymerase subunit sigma-24 [Clostridiales bacterium]|nr:RNA polymerase subunit sigma-24 [Clostridiales bacterium]